MAERLQEIQQKACNLTNMQQNPLQRSQQALDQLLQQVLQRQEQQQPQQQEQQQQQQRLQQQQQQQQEHPQRDINDSSFIFPVPGSAQCGGSQDSISPSTLDTQPRTANNTTTFETNESNERNPSAGSPPPSQNDVTPLNRCEPVSTFSYTNKISIGFLVFFWVGGEGGL